MKRIRNQHVLAAFLLCVLLCLSGCSSATNVSGPTEGVEPSAPDISVVPEVVMLETTCSAEDWCAHSHDSVVAELRDIGFTKIQVVPEEDLTTEDAHLEGIVKSVSINGRSDFIKGTEFPEDSKIVVTYHTIIKGAIPISSENIQDYTLVELETMFSDAGFINITVEEILDLDPDAVDVEYINELYVDKNSEFTQGDILPYDAEISIICHRPYEKHTVDVHLDFVSNIIFNRYGIVVSVDDEEIKTLSHGEDADFSFRVKAGKYTLTFTSAKSSTLKHEMELDVSSDIEASFRLTCYSDEIEIKTHYIDRNVELAENEAKVPTSASVYRYGDYTYQTIADELKAAGFTNITTIALYDIYLGLTEEGAIQSVSINGNESFTQGQIFAADAEVIIKYHMPEDADPSKITAPNGSAYYVGMDYIEVKQIFEDLGFNNILLYSTTTEDTTYKDGEVYAVKLSSWKFSQGDKLDPDGYIMIWYYEVDEPVYISMPESTDAYIGKNYQEVVQIFKDLGFTDVDIEEETTSDSSWSDGEVFSVTADYSTFEQGESFEQDDRICVKYYVYEAPTPVFYSTNDYTTATKGNTGVFSYKSSGVSYDIYWIIDFDKGYVYYFTDGNGDSYCDRLKIESGDLNTKITITYHDGNSQWSYYLHFKYVNHPETLIMVDQNGFDYKYSTTDLHDALRLRDSKTIKDY